MNDTPDRPDRRYEPAPRFYTEKQGVTPDEGILGLRDAIMLACPPHPGYTLEGFIVFMTWESDDKTHRRGDGIMFPDTLGAEMADVAHNILHHREEGL